ncbi:helix-turn-helix domain-containing protein [Agromyces bauzanensis]|uniref:Transcriptional regulator n=1 Tax=Agromyces bauzanensis TaxID=1308924 RepID=A0A917UQW8_9MICO|nr:hypothetical protein [Agromyces bauzanensis]GGJ77959.1 transcriptional regulator [Agromyces bauzanensis]
MRANVLSDAIARAQKAELARRAGISRTTALHLRDDISRARVSTLRELALALGYDIRIDLERASDPLASAAARSLLGDLDESAEYREWVERLQRYCPSGEPLGIVDEAARVSAPQHRGGSVMLSGRNDADRLVSAGVASGARWALSGAAALEALGSNGGGTVLMWSEDVTRAAQLLGGTHRRVKAEAAADVVIAPAHPSVFEGSTQVDDVVLVSPVQAIIDSFGLGGEVGATARRVAEAW